MAHRGKLGLPDASLISGDERIRACRFAMAFSLVPKFDEVAAFGVNLIRAVDAHMIAPHAAFAVVKGGNARPVSVDLDSFEQLDAGNLCHRAVPGRNRHHPHRR